MTFAERLKTLRIKAGKSRYRLAQYSGIDQAYIHRLETGERTNPGRQIVLMLAFALVENTPVAVLSLADHLALPAKPEGDAVEGREQVLLLAEIRGELMALEIDAVVGHQQIYVKPVPELLSGLRPLSGLTILGDGAPVFLLDLNQLS